MKTVLCILSAILVAALSYSQDRGVSAGADTAQPVSGNLHTITNIKTPFAATNFGKVTCDTSGNIYLRQYDGSPEFLHAPVLKLRPDGNPSGSFGLTDATLTGVVHGFFVASGSEVYLLAWGRTTADSGYHNFIVRFANSEPLESKFQVDMDKRVTAAHLAVFDSGEILITGRNRFTPFIELFSSNGRLIKDIFVREDEELVSCF